MVSILCSSLRQVRGLLQNPRGLLRSVDSPAKASAFEVDALVHHAASGLNQDESDQVQYAHQCDKIVVYQPRLNDASVENKASRALDAHPPVF